MTLRRLAAAALYVLPLLLIAPLSSSAQTDGDDALARRLFETGRAYFERAQYEEAAESFAEAYRLSGRTSLLVNLARAQEESGQLPEAIESLTRALDALPTDDEMRPTVMDRLARLQAEQEQLEVAAAEVEEAEEIEPAGEPWEADPGVMWWSGVGAVSLAGASFVVALGTGVSSHRIYEDLKENCPMDVCLPEYEADRDRAQRLSSTATAFVVVGIAASATGLVLMLLSRDHDEAEPEPAVEVIAGPGQLGTGLRLRF